MMMNELNMKKIVEVCKENEECRKKYITIAGHVRQYLLACADVQIAKKNGSGERVYGRIGIRVIENGGLCDATGRVNAQLERIGRCLIAMNAIAKENRYGEIYSISVNKKDKEEVKLLGRYFLNCIGEE